MEIPRDELLFNAQPGSNLDLRGRPDERLKALRKRVTVQRHYFLHAPTQCLTPYLIETRLCRYRFHKDRIGTENISYTDRRRYLIDTPFSTDVLLSPRLRC